MAAPKRICNAIKMQIEIKNCIFFVIKYFFFLVLLFLFFFQMERCGSLRNMFVIENHEKSITKQLKSISKQEYKQHSITKKKRVYTYII